MIRYERRRIIDFVLNNKRHITIPKSYRDAINKQPHERRSQIEEIWYLKEIVKYRLLNN